MKEILPFRRPDNESLVAQAKLNLLKKTAKFKKWSYVFVLKILEDFWTISILSWRINAQKKQKNIWWKSVIETVL